MLRRGIVGRGNVIVPRRPIPQWQQTPPQQVVVKKPVEVEEQKPKG